MDNEQFSRTIGLIGIDEYLYLKEKTILIAGIGGVGGTTFEALLRMGFEHFILVDKDVVSLSNLNRQVLYKKDNVGKLKVEVARDFALSINENADIKIYPNYVQEVISEFTPDIIVDAIDDIEGKIALIKHANEKNIPIVVSTGMANKMDPSKITIGSLNKSSVDPLAKKLRYELKRREIDFSSIDCVYSTETPFKDGAKLNSIITVTSTAGLFLAYYVFSFLKRR